MRYPSSRSVAFSSFSSAGPEEVAGAQQQGPVSVFCTGTRTAGTFVLQSTLFPGPGDPGFPKLPTRTSAYLGS
eukprot:3581692-Rhodomonas_salina.1